MCSVCKHPVEKFLQRHDELTQQSVYEALCHGEIQTVHVSDELRYSGSIVGVGEAFATDAGKLRRRSA